MRSRLDMAMQREPGPVIDLGFDHLQEAHAVAFKKGQWNAVAISTLLPASDVELGPGREDAARGLTDRRQKLNETFVWPASPDCAHNASRNDTAQVHRG